MDAIASVSGVGAVAGRVSFTGSLSPTAASGGNVEDDVSIQALKLIQAAVANTPTGVQQLDLRA